MSSEFLNFTDLTREARLNLAKTLLDAPGIDTETNIKILLNTPPAQENPKALELISSVADAQKTYLTIKDILNESLSKKISKIAGIGFDVPLDEIVGALAEENDVKNISALLYLTEREIVKPNSGSNEMLAAVSHYSLNIAHKFYKECSTTESKTRARTYYLYFAAIEVLVLGVETNATLQAIYPEAETLNLEGGPTATITFGSKEELSKCALKEIFEGGKATPVTNLGGRYISTIIPNSNYGVAEGDASGVGDA